MSTKLRHIGMFSGNTILGDGAVIMIIVRTVSRRRWVPRLPFSARSSMKTPRRAARLPSR